MLTRILVIASFLSIGSLYLLDAQAQEVDIQYLRSCLPNTSGRYLIEKHEIVGKTVDEGNEYYLVNSLSSVIQPGQQQQSITQVLKTSQAGCSVIFSNPMGDFVSLSNFMPQTVARNLTYSAMMKQAEDLGSTQAFIERFKSATSDAPVVLLTDEEFWALKKLGYSLPKNQKLELIP